jgi:hypothetical protein
METADGGEMPAYRAISWIFIVEVRYLSHVGFVEEKLSVG